MLLPAIPVNRTIPPFLPKADSPSPKTKLPNRTAVSNLGKPTTGRGTSKGQLPEPIFARENLRISFTTLTGHYLRMI